MPKVVTIEQMQAIEAAADAAGRSYAEMMDAAGQAVAERILLHLGHNLEDPPRVVVVAGPGNNGGDGLVAARYVKEIHTETEISCYLLKPRGEDDPVFTAARDAGVFIADAENDINFRVLKNLIIGANVLIDALFGTGSRLPIEDDAAKLLRAAASAIETGMAEYPHPRSISPALPAEEAQLRLTIDHFREALPDSFPQKPFIIAVDCPSGLNCDTGELDDLTLFADETVTFAAAKPGLLTFPGAEAVGRLHIGDIGLPDKLPERDDIKIDLITASKVGQILPERSPNSHKGTFGKAFIVAGSLNFIGAAYLAAAAAYRIGTGLVTVALPQSIISPVASSIPEATWVLLPNNMGVINKAAAKIAREESNGYQVMLIGPGIGNEEDSQEFMDSLLQPETTAKKSHARLGLLKFDENEGVTMDDDDDTNELPPLVIDADGLNILAQMDDWWTKLPPKTVLTPHPREFVRLSDVEDVATVQANRVSLAQEKAAEWDTLVVLKGAFTVVAHPDGRTAISPFASASLATAGTGDVLSGAIAGLVAQGLDIYEAAVAGVWLHGWAGTHDRPKRGNLASDVIHGLQAAMEVASLAT